MTDLTDVPNPPDAGDRSEPPEPPESPRRLPALGSPPAAVSGAPSLEFHESMRGWATSAAPDDPVRGGALGHEANIPFSFDVHITLPDLKAVLADPSITGHIRGTAIIATLSDGPLEVIDGRFQLFAVDPEVADGAMMRYSMPVCARDGAWYRVEGVKLIHNDPGFDSWRDTTLLEVTISDWSGQPVASGQARIGVLGVAALAASVRVRNGRAFTRWLWKARFLRVFLSSLGVRYGKLLAQAAEFRATARDIPLATSRGPAMTAQWWCTDANRQDWIGADRGPAREWTRAVNPGRQGGQAPGEAWLSLRRFEGTRGPVMLAPGFGMSSDHYLLETTGQNLVEYLHDRDYDVWLFDYRAGINLESAREECTLDDIARADWPVAVAKVLEETGAESVHVVAHCVGSMTVQMAVLAGTEGIGSIVASQVTVHPVVAPFNRFKANYRVAERIAAFGVDRIRFNPNGTLPDRLLDLALSCNPLLKGERCSSPACRWIFGFYGPTHRHLMLNAATHDLIPELFGVGNARALEHVGRIVKIGHAVDFDGKEAYLPNVARLDMPILFLAGRYNNIFRPASSVRTIEWLRAHNDPSLYRREELPDYAHLDGLIGSDADLKVYPKIGEHLAAVSG